MCNTTLAARILILIIIVASPAAASPDSLPAVGATEFDRPLSKCWIFKNAEPSPRIAESDNGQTYLVSPETRNLRALDAATGEPLWISDLEGDFKTFFVNSKGTPVVLFQVTGGTDMLRALSTKTGLTLWQRPLPYSVSKSLKPAYEARDAGARSSDEIYMLGDGGELSVVDLDSGILNQVGKFDRIGSGAAVLVGGRLVYPFTGRWKSVDIDSGREEIFSQAQETITAMSAIGSVRFASGDSTGALVTNKISAEKPSWRFKAGGGIDQILPFGASIIVSSRDNYLYSLDSTFGTRNWKRRLAGRLLPIAASGRFGAVGVADSNALEIIDLRNGRKINEITMDQPIVEYRLYERFLLVKTLQGVTAFSATCADTKKPGK